MILVALLVAFVGLCLASKPNNVHFHHGISADERSELLGHRGLTVYMSGLSGAGKSTIGVALERALLAQGRPAYRLDGDNLRTGLSADLGFSVEDRTEQMRRVGEVAALFADAGQVAIVCLISPLRAMRRAAAETHARKGLRFMEVFVDVPLAVAEERDPKGLYAKVRAGQIANFTGIDSPFEAPENPDVHLKTHELSVEEAVQRIMAEIQQSDEQCTDGPR